MIANNKTYSPIYYSFIVSGLMLYVVHRLIYNKYVNWFCNQINGKNTANKMHLNRLQLAHLKRLPNFACAIRSKKKACWMNAVDIPTKFGTLVTRLLVSLKRKLIELGYFAINWIWVIQFMIWNFNCCCCFVLISLALTYWTCWTRSKLP